MKVFVLVGAACFNPDTVRFEHVRVHLYTDEAGVGFNPDTVRFEPWLWEHCGDGYVSTPIRFDLNGRETAESGSWKPRFNPDTVRFEPTPMTVSRGKAVSTPIRFDLNRLVR